MDLNRPKSRLSGPWILVAVIVVLLGMDAAVYWMMNFAEFSMAAVIGAGLAQAGFHCILAGAIGRHWLLSFVLGLALSVVAFCIFFQAMQIQSTEEEPWVICAMISGLLPVILFFGAAPWLLLRMLFGISLVRGEAGPKTSIHIEDFFLSSGVIGAALVSANNAMRFLNTDDADSTPFILGALALIPFTASAVTVIPVSVIYFWCKSLILRMIVLIVFCGLGVCAGMLMLVMTSGFAVEALYTFVPEVIIFSILLTLLRASGYELKKHVTIPVKNLDAFSDSGENPDAAAVSRLPNRVAVVCLLLLSTGFTVWVSDLNGRRALIAQELQRTNYRLREHGGSLTHRGHVPYELFAPSSAASGEIDELLKYRTWAAISLENAQVTSKQWGQLKELKRLQYLNLNGSTIDDEGFLELAMQYRYIRNLRLGRTKIGHEALVQGFQKLQFQKLDVSDLGIDDKLLERLQLDRQVVNGGVGRLNLSGNPVTDKSLISLTTIAELDLSNTKVTGKDFDMLTLTESLAVDDTEVDDAALLKLQASAVSLESISIRNTKVTDEGLKSLKNFKLLSGLNVGEGPITAAGILNCGHTGWKHLGLNAKKFDGSLFIFNTPFSIIELDMSDSGITDADVGALSKIAALSKLSLARCNITAAALPALKDLNLNELDLTDTAIQAADVQKVPELAARVRLSLKQCGNDISSDALDAMNIQISEWENWDAQ
ncbi:MAG: hypothetical protein U0892_10010 [Pirellulales bacterium]